MPRTKADAVAEFRCQEILEAARRVFALHGFNDTTLEHITEAAGISKGTFYLYFPSKREVFFEALKQGIRELLEETERRMEHGTSTKEKIHIFVVTRLRYFERNRDFFRIYCAELGSRLSHPLQQDGVGELYLKLAQILEQILEDGIARGELRPLRSRSTAFTIYDMTRGVISQRLMGWSEASVEDDAEQLFDLIWRGIREDS